MIIFEVVDGQVTGAGDAPHHEILQSEVENLEFFAKKMGAALGKTKHDRVVATFESRGFGIRYSTSDEETFSGRGVEIKGRKTPGNIVDKLY